MRNPRPGPSRPFAPLALTALLLVATTAVGAQEREIMLEGRWDVDPDATLRVEVGDADVDVSVGEPGQVEIRVLLRADDMERGRERYERMNVRADGNRREVVLSDDPEGGLFWSRGDRGSFSVTAEIRVPESLDLDLETGDGDVRVEAAAGARTRIGSGDGDITAGSLRGHVDIHTGDGDVRLDAFDGSSLEVRSGDGDIDLGDLAGGSIVVRTSDGDIDVRAVAGESIEARTSDGDVDLRGVRGELTVNTSDGEIFVRVEELGDTTLQSGDGDIDIEAPAGLAARLDLRGEEVRIRPEIRFTGRVEEERVEGDLNGGGPELRAHTGDGTVSLRIG